MKHLKYLLPLLFVVACTKDKPSETTPNYAGNWGGTYSITSCTQSGQVGSLVNLCGSNPVGSVLSHRFEFSQVGRTVSGQFYLGTLLFPFSPATIGSDGSLTVAGITVNESASVQATWNLHRSGTAFTGTLATTWSSTGLTGTAQLNGSTQGAVTPRSTALPSLAPPLTIYSMRDRLLAP